METAISTPCVSLFYVNDIGSTGSRGRTRGIPCVYRTLDLDFNAGYAVLVTAACVPPPPARVLVLGRTIPWTTAAAAASTAGCYGWREAATPHHQVGRMIRFKFLRMIRFKFLLVMSLLLFHVRDPVLEPVSKIYRCGGQSASLSMHAPTPESSRRPLPTSESESGGEGVQASSERKSVTKRVTATKSCTRAHASRNVDWRLDGDLKHHVTETDHNTPDTLDALAQTATWCSRRRWS